MMKKLKRVIRTGKERVGKHIIYPHRSCSKCGTNIEYEDGTIYYAIRPKKYRHVCPNCGKVSYFIDTYGGPIGYSRGELV